MITTRALTLSERKELYLSGGKALPPPSAKGLDYAAWLTRAQFGGDKKRWRQWLSLSDMTVDQASRLIELDRPLDPEEWASVTKTGWGKCLAEALGEFEGWRAPDTLRDEPGLQTIGMPFVLWARQRLQSFLDARADQAPSITPLVVERAIQWLQSMLHYLATPTIGMAINIARLREELQGETPEARGADFARQLLDPARRAQIVAAFPVLDRILAQFTANALVGLKEMLLRLSLDHSQLKDRYAIGDELTDIGIGKGDAHNGGRTVCFLSFGETRLVYKPRSMGPEVAFGALLAWLGPQMGVDLDLMDVFDRGDYAWVNFVEYRECASEQEVEDAHRNMGRVLAALHLCLGSDLHFENLIFHGDRPVVVDLETLLVSIPRHRLRQARIRAKAFSGTLLALGYLPTGMATGKADLTAGGFDDEREIQASRIQGSGRDDVRISSQPVMMHPGQNVPRLDGKIRSASESEHALVEGFQEAYQLLLKGRAFLAGPESPLEGFRTAGLRWVARATMQYGALMLAARHPTRTRDAVDHEMALAGLLAGGRAHAKVELDRFACERADMLSGDIPYFKATPDSLDTQGVRGGVVPKALYRTPWTNLKTRLRQLSLADMERQTNIIQICFESRRPRDAGRTIDPARPRLRETGADDLSGAIDIGKKVCERAFLVDGLPFWARVTHNDVQERAVTLTEGGFYDGAAGIGVFLAELGALTGQARFKNMALKCLKLLRRGENQAGRIVGAYNGRAGLLYADVRISQALGLGPDPSWRRQLDQIREDAPSDPRLDIISGVAGAAIVAVRIAEVFEDLRAVALETARACGDRLTETVERSEDGACWRIPTVPVPLTGLSHGTSGFAWALGELAVALERDHYFDLAREALAYEDASFDHERRGWRDLRPLIEGDSIGGAWCHGAPGMALARSRLLRLGMPDPGGRRAAETQYAVHDDSPAFAEPCLCHGMFGNAEILGLLGPRFADASDALFGAAHRAASNADALEASLGFNSPGLLTGLSGVGLAMLRRASPAVPSVLSLDLWPQAERAREAS